MILVDSSIWIDHLRAGNAALFELLSQEKVLCHPFIIGELVLGDLRQFQLITTSLQDLPQTAVAEDSEMINFIHRNQLSGTGIGYIDAHLLAAVKLTPGSKLWTKDKRLQRVAERLGIAISA